MKLTQIMDVDELKQLNRSRGYHFFSRDTMRFFASRLLSYMHHVDNEVGHFVVFITSEKKCFNDPTRVYHVRVMDEQGRVLSGKEAFDNRRQAIQYAAMLGREQKLPQQIKEGDPDETD